MLGVNVTAHLVGATALKNGDDLNDCMVGSYRSGSQSITNSLVNCPITGVGFVLWVMSGYGSNTSAYLRQIAIAHWSIYTRGKGASGSEWTEWKQFQIS